MACCEAKSAELTKDPSAFSEMLSSSSPLGRALSKTLAAAPPAWMAACCSRREAWDEDMLEKPKVSYICTDAGVPKG
jgi:hypothetical protein